MSDRIKCPKCGTYDTEQVHVEWFKMKVEEVRICHKCTGQYILSLANPIVKSVQTGDGSNE